MTAKASAAERAHPGNGGRAVVLYDGHCAFCRKSVGLLQRLDWMNVLRYGDVRDPAQVPAGSVPGGPERLLEEMHLITPNRDKVYHGFGAFRWMAWRLPLLWFLVPFLYLPGAATLGQRAYLWVARNRFRLVPCHGGVCTLPPPGAGAHRTAPSPPRPGGAAPPP